MTLEEMLAEVKRLHEAGEDQAAEELFEQLYDAYEAFGDQIDMTGVELDLLEEYFEQVEDDEGENVVGDGPVIDDSVDTDKPQAKFITFEKDPPAAG